MGYRVGFSKRVEQGVMGGQGKLVLAQVPTAADQSLVGKTLLEAGQLTVAGDYYCDFYVGGAAAAECHLTATIAASTASSEVYTTYNDGTTAKQGFASDGALATTTLQSSTISTLIGEQIARCKITLGAAPQVTFTVGEYNCL